MMHQRAGDKWGYITVLGTKNTIKEVQNGAVRDRFTEVTLLLKCRCGKEFSMPYYTFPGRRAVKDCGCGIALANIGQDLKTSVSVYMDMGLLNRITRYAYDSGKSLSRAMVDLMESGMQAVEDEQSTGNRK